MLLPHLLLLLLLLLLTAGVRAVVRCCYLFPTLPRYPVVVDVDVEPTPPRCYIGIVVVVLLLNLLLNDVYVVVESFIELITRC